MQRHRRVLAVVFGQEHDEAAVRCARALLDSGGSGLVVAGPRDVVARFDQEAETRDIRDHSVAWLAGQVNADLVVAPWSDGTRSWLPWSRRHRAPSPEELLDQVDRQMMLVAGPAADDGRRGLSVCAGGGPHARLGAALALALAPRLQRQPEIVSVVASAAQRERAEERIRRCLDGLVGAERFTPRVRVAADLADALVAEGNRTGFLVVGATEGRFLERAVFGRLSSRLAQSHGTTTVAVVQSAGKRP